MTPMPFTDFCGAVLGVKLTRPQVVLCRVAFDGVEPADLLTAEDRAIARELFGDVDQVPLEARLVFALLKGARVGGTWLCSLQLLHAALTAPLAGLAAGETAYAPIVAPDLKTAKVALNYARGAAGSVATIDRLVTEDRREGFTLTRHDGRAVSIETLAASRGGSTLRGRSMVSALLDESSFFRDADSGVVNDSEIFRAVAPRIIPGGRLSVISTAWAEAGLLWDLVGKNHGHPRSALAAKAPTLTMRPDHPQIRTVVQEERERDPANAAREFDCIPFTGEASGFFAPHALAECRTDAPVILTPERGRTAWAGIDVAFKRDASALVVVRRDGACLEVCEVLEVKPTAGQPLVPSEVVRAFVERARYHAARELVADHYYLEAVREHAGGSGLRLITAPAGQSGKVTTYVATQQALHEGRVRISAHHKRLLRQLGEVRSQPTPGGGLRITSPRRPGSHGDVASAFVNAVWAATDPQRRATDRYVSAILAGSRDMPT